MVLGLVIALVAAANFDSRLQDAKRVWSWIDGLDAERVLRVAA